MQLYRTGSDTQLWDNTLCKTGDCVDVSNEVGVELLTRGGWSGDDPAATTTKVKRTKKTTAKGEKR